MECIVPCANDDLNQLWSNATTAKGPVEAQRASNAGQGPETKTKHFTRVGHCNTALSELRHTACPAPGPNAQVNISKSPTASRQQDSCCPAAGTGSDVARELEQMLFLGVP